MSPPMGEIQKRIRSVLLPNKHGLLLTDLRSEYRAIFGVPLDWQALGHPSLLSLVRDMPYVVSVEELGSGHILLHATPDRSTQHIAEMVRQQRDNVMGYNQHTGQVLARQSFRKVSCFHTALLNSSSTNTNSFNNESNNNNIYNTKTSDIDVPSSIRHHTERSSTTSEEVLRYVPEGEEALEPEDNPKEGRPMGVGSAVVSQLLDLFAKFPAGLAHSSLAKQFRLMFGRTLDPLEHGCSSLLELCSRLPDAVRLQSPPRPHLPWVMYRADSQLRESLWKVGQVVEVVVFAIRSPNDFHVVPKCHQEELHRMGRELEFKKGERGKVQLSDLQEGLAVSCVSSKKRGLFRGQVVRVRENMRVQVYYSDYGILDDVDLDSLTHLEPELEAIPGLAVQACLWGVENPEEGGWNKAATRRLKELVVSAEKAAGAVLAMVEDCGDGLIVALDLIDTVTNDLSSGVSFSEVLVKEGLAMASKRKHQQEVLEKRKDVENVRDNKDNDVKEKFVKYDEYVDEVKNARKDEDSARGSSLDGSTSGYMSNGTGSRSEPLTTGTGGQVKGGIALSGQLSTGFTFEGTDAELIRVPFLQTSEEEGRGELYLVKLESGFWWFEKEIVHLVPAWRGRNLLQKMLKIKSVEVVNKVIRKVDYPFLWEQLEEVGELSNDQLTLYRLEDLRLVVSHFGHYGGIKILL